MSTRVLRSIRGRRIRITRLDGCGDPIATGCNTVVSSCFASVEIAAEQDPGPRHVSRDIWGALNLADAEPDQALWATVTIRLADVNPDVITLLSGEEPVLLDGEAYGVTVGAARNYSAYALEVWSEALGEGCGAWGYLSIPLVRNGRLDGSFVIENGVASLSAVGTAFPATEAWGSTPYEENPFPIPFPAGQLFGMVVTSSPPPEDIDFSLCPERLLEGAVLWIDSALSETA